MITAQEALQQSLTGDPQRMLLIAESKIKEAVSKKQSSCTIEYSRYLYSDLDIRVLYRTLQGLGYFCYPEFMCSGNNHKLEVRW